jgi:Large extracellular alpha-helical protein
MSLDRTSGRLHARTTGRISLLLGALLVLSSLAIGPATAAVPTLATDKPDYRPDETVHITGTGYEPGDAYDVPVTRPDGTMVHGDASDLPGWDSVTADGSGNLTYDYILDGIFGVYEARVYPSPWSGNWAEAPLAVVTFTDGANLDQCANDEPGTPPCKWQNSNLNGNNSAYAEGDVVPFRLRVEDIAAGAHTIHLNYDFTQGGNKAYDFLATYDATEQVNICGPGGGGQPSSLCPVGAPTDTELFPLDPFSSDGIQVQTVQNTFGANRLLSIWGGTITGSSVPVHVRRRPRVEQHR